MAKNGIWKHFRSNKNQTWIKIKNPGEGEDWLFLVARMGRMNKKYTAAMAKLIKPVEKLYENGLLANEQLEEMVNESLFKTVILDWKNVCDEDNEPLEFTAENMIFVFENLPDIYDQVIEVVRKITTFQDEADEEDVKNS